MTATGVSAFREYTGASDKNTMLDYSIDSCLAGPRLTSVPCSSASLSSCAPTGSLLDRKVVGAPPAGGLLQRRHSVSLTSPKLSQNQLVGSFKTDQAPVLLGSCCSGNNKENRFRERSLSELGDRLRPGSQLCVGGSSQVNSSRYKTELCRPFEESGTCKYGDKCQFAHGMHELRSLSRHPKYKTELCRTFHSTGICPYGPRCHFIHNAEECRGPLPLSAFNKMERPRLQHSLSFAGFPSGLRDTEDPADWQSNPFTYYNQELASLFGSSFRPPPASEHQGLAPPSPTIPCFFQPPSERPPSPADSLSDQEGYQSSGQSGSESPLLDPSRRLPIFSRLSISFD